MLAKPLIQQLQEAIGAGDLEGAKVLADRIGAKVGPKKAPASPKVAPKKKTPKGAPKKPRGAPQTAPAPFPEGEAPVRPQKPHRPGDPISGRQARLVEEIPVFTNTYDPNQDRVILPPSHEKVDKKLRKAPVLPRPGQPGSDREAFTTIRVVCGRCQRGFDIAPEEDNATDEVSTYRCNSCSMGGR